MDGDGARDYDHDDDDDPYGSENTMRNA